MIEKDKIRRGLSPRREIASYQTQSDIIIPAGTILRGNGAGVYSAIVGLGEPQSQGCFSVSIPAGTATPAKLKRVAA